MGSLVMGRWKVNTGAKLLPVAVDVNWINYV